MTTVTIVTIDVLYSPKQVTVMCTNLRAVKRSNVAVRT